VCVCVTKQIISQDFCSQVLGGDLCISALRKEEEISERARMDDGEQKLLRNTCNTP